MSENIELKQSWVNECSDILDKFEDVVALDPIIPKNMSRLCLLRYLHIYDYNIDKAIKLLHENVKFRKNHLNIFSNRKLNSKEMFKAMDTLQLILLPHHTKENYQLMAFRFVDYDTRNLDMLALAKYGMMFHDTLHKTARKSDGQIFILDAKGFSFWHFMKVVANPSILLAVLKYEQDCSASKIIQNHVVNCSPVLKGLVRFLKPFVNSELHGTFQFHSSGFDSLHQCIPKELLPDEYEGNAGKLDEIFKDTVNLIYEEEDYLVNDENFF